MYTIRTQGMIQRRSIISGLLPEKSIIDDDMIQRNDETKKHIFTNDFN